MQPRSEVSDIVWDGPLMSYHEGLILGNGDLGGVLYGNQWELKLSLGKNDVWDARFDSDAEDDILTHDDLIRLVEEYGVEAFRSGQTGDLGGDLPQWMLNPVGKKAVPSDIRTVYATPAYYEKGRYCRPCTKRVGEIVFVGPGLSTTPMKSRLRIGEGVFSVAFEYTDQARIEVEGFIWAESNVLCLRVKIEGDMKWGKWSRLVMRKFPDAVDASIPDPVLETPYDQIVSLTQEIPGDEVIDPFAWTLAGAVPGRRIDHRYESIVNLPQEEGVTDFIFAVSTTREVKNARGRAVEMAVQARTQGYDKLKESQREWWAGFWQRSGVELDDPELEAAWYRDLYFLACNLKEGMQAPGLYGNMTMWDASMWHDDYHMDKNFQKNFYPVLVTNHCDMSGPYFDAIGDHMPSAQFRAEKDYGVEGAFIDVSILPYQPPERMYINNTNGRQLGLAGWTLGQYWQYWQYTKDRDWLAETGYPVIKKVAQFYWNYLEKYQERCGGDIYPSACLESLPCYRNVFQDLLFFKYAFRVAMRTAEALGVDDGWRARWQEGHERVPDYKIIEYDGKKRLATHKGENERGHYSGTTFHYCGYVVGPLIFPGEEVDPESDSEMVEIIRGGLEEFRFDEARTHNFLSYAIEVPAARLRMERAYEMVRHAVNACRYPTGTAAMFNNMDTGIHGLQMYPYGLQVEDFTMPLSITELLLQSYNEVIRLFPAWPQEKQARFELLRAEGGFLVSSSQEGGRVGATEIRSMVGGTCRLQWPWGEAVVKDAAGKAVTCQKEGDRVVFETEKGGVYSVEAAQ